MICSYVNDDKYGVINLHAEQVYTTVEELTLSSVNFNNISIEHPEYLNSAIYSNILTITTINKLVDFFSILNSLPKFIIIDFDKILSIQKNLRESFDKLSKIITSKSSQILLINLDEKIKNSVNIEDENNLSYLKNQTWITKENSTSILDGVEYDNFLKMIEGILQKKKEDYLKKSFNKQDPPEIHESSSVYLNQYFDFKYFISKDSFIYYCLYELALKMIKKTKFHDWEIKPTSRIVLFCQTLNGAFIASILSDLLGLDLFLMDHLGPINKIYSNKLYGKIDETANYIVVSDVLCLGTEVKTSKSIIEFSGAKYLGNVSFLRIETRKDEDIDFKDIDFFYRITKDYNPVNYKISTALD